MVPAPAKQPGTSSSGVFAGDDPIKTSTVSLLILQMFIIVVFSRFIGQVLKPLRQPQVIAEIIAGILIGPSAIGRSQFWLDHVFPKSSLSILNTVANIGLIFFLFLVGLEIDVKALRTIGKNAVYVSAAGIALPFVTGIGASYIIRETLDYKEGKIVSFVVFMGVAMSITAFPVLARILAERKILTTDIGQLTMSAAAVDDVIAWCLLALAIALINSKSSPIIALYSFLCLIAFIAFMLLVVGPIMKRVSDHTKAYDRIPPTIILTCFIGALSFGFLTDLIGVHSIFGGFVFGFVIPKDGPLAHALEEKIEDFVVMLFIPLFFASSGLKTQISVIDSWKTFGLLVLVIIVACVGKITGCSVFARFAGHTWRKSLTVGVLMNTKGLVEIIVLNIGLQEKVINTQIFTIMVLMALVTTFMTSPIVSFLYVPNRDDKAEDELHEKRNPKKARQVVGTKDLSILACVSSFQSIPTMVNVIEAAESDLGNKLKVDSLHLLELSERNSTFMKLSGPDAKTTYAMDPVNLVFKGHGRLGHVNIRPAVAISPIDTMHEDVLLAADRKRSNLILMPLSESSGFSFLDGTGSLNQVALKVLKLAKSSVGIVVDQGHDAKLGPAVVQSNKSYRVLVPFLGGADDREALSLAFRMSEHPLVALTVVRILLGKGIPGEAVPTDNAGDVVLNTDAILAIQNSKEDADLLAAVKAKASAANANEEKDHVEDAVIEYEEKHTANPISAALDALLAKNYDLVIVGRGVQYSSASWIDAATTSSLPAETQEIMGPIAKMLVVPEAEQQPSLLIMQAPVVDPSSSP